MSLSPLGSLAGAYRLSVVRFTHWGSGSCYMFPFICWWKDHVDEGTKQGARLSGGGGYCSPVTPEDKLNHLQSRDDMIWAATLFESRNDFAISQTISFSLVCVFCIWVNDILVEKIKKCRIGPQIMVIICYSVRGELTKPSSRFQPPNYKTSILVTQSLQLVELHLVV